MGLFGESKPGAVTIRGTALRCEICKHEAFFHKRAQLNTAVATFFKFDWVNPTAECLVCAQCGYIHWFLPLDE